MKIFVAGAAGVIGRKMLPMLVRAGHEVTGMSRKEEQCALIESMGCRAVIGDALDREAIRSAVFEAKPEAIIHQLTSLSTWNLTDNAKIRAEGTRNLVDAALAANATRIIAQSISWAYEPGVTPATEEVPLDVDAPEPRKTTVNGVMALEQAVAEMPHYVILRYGMLYGQDTWYDSNGIMADKARRRQLAATEGITSFLHVEDAAHAALLALDWPAGPVNIVDNEPAAGTEWVPVYADALGAPKPEFQTEMTRAARGASNTKAKDDYGWKPLYPTWRTGFAL